MAEVQTLTGKVVWTNPNNEIGFLFAPLDGEEEQWPLAPTFKDDGTRQVARFFTISKNRETGRLECRRPEKGDEIRVAYEHSPAKGEWGETFWVKNWHENGAELAVDVDKPTGRGTYATAQEEAADRASAPPEPKKAYPDREAITRESIERQVALKATVEMWKGVETIPDAKVIADYARNLYAGLFNHALGHTHDDGPPPEQDVPLQDGDPGPQPD